MWQLVTEIVTGYHQCQIVMGPGWLSQLSSYEDGSGMDNEVYLCHSRSYSGLRRWFMQNDKLMRFKIVQRLLIFHLSILGPNLGPNEC